MPKGLTYPLKSSLLEEAMATNDITTHLTIRYGLSYMLFEALYWPPTKNIKYDRFYITTGAVEACESIKAKEYLARTVIPKFVNWAGDLTSLPINSPRVYEKPRFSMDLLRE